LSCQKPQKRKRVNRDQNQNRNQNQRQSKAAVGLVIIVSEEQGNMQKAAVLKINMFKWFKKAKPIPLGRWAFEHVERKIDLANCDSCGTCAPPQPPLKLKYKYMIVDDDIVLEGILQVDMNGKVS